MLQITNLHANVGEKPILKGLTLSLNAGEIHAIMGPNGAGKSTLGYVLSGRPGYEVTEGSVTFHGNDLLDLEPHGRMARRDRGRHPRGPRGGILLRRARDQETAFPSWR